MGLSLSTPSDETLSSNRITGFMSKVRGQAPPPAEAPFVTRAPVGQGVLAPGSTLGRECGTAFRGGDPHLVT